jgi:2-hydroxy-6-oxonona-2,4-dienedioate hydrolase
MTTAMQTRNTTHDARAERYRAAERTLWAAHGLEPAERFIDLDEVGGSLRVLDIGAGDPVLFLPGTGGTGPYWAPLVRELKADRRCLLVDRPGWGLSTPVDYRNRPYGDIAAATLTCALDALGIERADTVGASIGNLWALRLAQHHPDRVGRIALIGGGPVVDLPVPRFIRMLASPLGAVIVRLPFSPKMARSQLEAIGHGPSVAAGRMDGFIDWRVAFARDTDSMRHERAMVRAILGRDGWRSGFIPTSAEIGGIDHSTRMIFGSADPTGSAEMWRAFTGRLPHGELQVVEGAGHMPWWDEPAKVGRLVGEFLGRSSAIRGAL